MSLRNKFLTLANGQKMPFIGLGTSKGDPAKTKASIRTALDVGYRMFDTAPTYGTEKAIGEALQEAIEAGQIKRTDVYIITKLTPTAMHPDRVERFCRASLRNLGVDYVDMYLVHAPFAFKYVSDDDLHPRNDQGQMLMDNESDLLAVWKKMEEMVDLGLTKCIGLSNCNREQIQRVLDHSRIPPVCHQFECHAYRQRRLMAEFCNARRITMTAFSPLGTPGFTSFLDKNFGIKENLPKMLDDPALTEIAKKHGKTPSQIALRWLIERGMNVIPKSENPQRIKENFEIFNFDLTWSDIQTIESLEKGLILLRYRLVGRQGFEEHPEYLPSLKD